MTQEKRARERSKVSAKETQLRLAGTSYNKEFSTIIRKVPMESIIKKSQLRIWRILLYRGVYKGVPFLLK